MVRAGGVLRAAEMQPIRVMQELAPVNAYRTQEGAGSSTRARILQARCA
ncbi:MAG: hypothetical protein ACLR7U_10740 [Ruthenibacterium lactatiformans]